MKALDEFALNCTACILTEKSSFSLFERTWQGKGTEVILKIATSHLLSSWVAEGPFAKDAYTLLCLIKGLV